MSARRLPRGFTLIEVLVALAAFAMVGVALVTLLGQGMGVFSAGTEDTSLQDRFQAFWPVIRDDLSSIHVGDRVGVPPPVVLDVEKGRTSTAAPPPPPRAPDVRLRSGWVRLLDAPADRPVSVFVAAWVKTNAREAEDPALQASGTAAASGDPKPFDPGAVDEGTTNLLPTGGLLEIAYVAVHVPPASSVAAPNPGVLTLYRCFRAPIGGKGSLLDVESLDTIAEIRTAGRPVSEGLLHFSISWRNVFATRWDEPAAAGRVEDGRPYVGLLWDSTRGDERHKDFPFHRGKESLGDPRDDMFPSRARVEMTLAAPAPFGWRSETALARPLIPDDTRMWLVEAEPLLAPGITEKWVKAGEEWLLASTVNLETREVVVARGRRGTKAVEHPASMPLFIGTQSSADVPLVGKDRYVRRR